MIDKDKDDIVDIIGEGNGWMIRYDIAPPKKWGAPPMVLPGMKEIEGLSNLGRAKERPTMALVSTKEGKNTSSQPRVTKNRRD
jgi:hypothetical protein